MGRLWLRVFMIGVGLATLAAYTAAGLGGLVLLQWLFTDPPGLIAVLIAFVGCVVVVGYVGYRFGTTRLLTSLDARTLPPDRAPAVYRRVARLCDRMTLDQPSLLVADLGAPNALSIGGPRGGTIVVDRNLLRLLTIDELEGILAHELAHIEGYDAFVQMLVLTAVRTFVGIVMLILSPLVLFLFGIDRAAAWIAGHPQRRRFGLAGLFQRAIQIVLAAVLSLLTLGVLAYSRRREFAADARAAEVTGKPAALARALVKIHRAAEPRRGLLSLLYIQHDRDRDSQRLFSTHPPLSERVERLRDRASDAVEHQRLDRLRGRTQ